MAAIVERDDAAAEPLELGNPAGIDPVDVLAGGEAVHEQDRIALAFVEIGNFDIAVMKARHRNSVDKGDQARIEDRAELNRPRGAAASAAGLRSRQAARPPRLLAAQPGIGQPLGGRLDRGQEAEQRQRQAKQP